MWTFIRSGLKFLSIFRFSFKHRFLLLLNHKSISLLGNNPVRNIVALNFIKKISVSSWLLNIQASSIIYTKFMISVTQSNNSHFLRHHETRCEYEMQKRRKRIAYIIKKWAQFLHKRTSKTKFIFFMAHFRAPLAFPSMLLFFLLFMAFTSDQH